MTDNEYELKKEEVLNDTILKGMIWDDEFTSGKFNLMSASLYNFLPKITYDKHEGIFRNISINQKLSSLEQGYLNIQNRIVYENFSPDLLNTLKNNNGITNMAYYLTNGTAFVFYYSNGVWKVKYGIA